MRQEMMRWKMEQLETEQQLDRLMTDAEKVRLVAPGNRTAGSA